MLFETGWAGGRPRDGLPSVWGNREPVSAGGWGPATGRAGGSAEARYVALHRAWWTRMRRRVRLLVLVGVGLFVLPAIAVAVWLDKPIWWFDAGIFVGALACM